MAILFSYHETERYRKNPVCLIVVNGPKKPVIVNSTGCVKRDMVLTTEDLSTIFVHVKSHLMQKITYINYFLILKYYLIVMNKNNIHAHSLRSLIAVSNPIYQKADLN